MQLRASVFLACALVAAVASSAFAQGDRDRARAAYEEGTKAFHRGDFTTAATRYAEADAIAPSAVALQAALDAAVKADDALLGAELLERARTRDVKGALATSVQTATTKLAHRAGKLTATCPSACTVTIDGSPFETARARWVKSGAHVVVFSIDGRTETKSVDVAPDAEITVEAPPAPTVTSPTPPPTTTVSPPPPVVVRVEPTPPPPQTFYEPTEYKKHKGGASPALFWVSLGATVALTAASTTLLVMTKSTHDDFVAKNCPTVASAQCQSLANQGSTTMDAGDALLGASIAAAIWTVIAGAVIVRWHAVDGSAAGGTSRLGSVDVAPQQHGAAVFWRLAF